MCATGRLPREFFTPAGVATDAGVRNPRGKQRNPPTGHYEPIVNVGVEREVVEVAPRWPDINRLHILVEFDRLGSLAAVAKSLSFTSSAVSQQMSKLQKEVGVELVRKRGKALELTEQGHFMVQVATRVLLELENAVSEVAGEAARVSGVLRIGALQTVIQKLLPEALELLAERYPMLTVELVQEEMPESVDRLIGGTVNVAIVEQFDAITDTVHRDMVRYSLFEEPMMLACRDDSIDSDLDPETLAGQRWVFEPGPSPAGRWAVDWCRRRGFEPCVRFESPDLLSHLRLIERGLAVGFVPHIMRGDVPQNLRLHRLPGAQREVFLSTGVSTSRHPAVLELVTLLRRLHQRDHATNTGQD